MFAPSFLPIARQFQVPPWLLAIAVCVLINGALYIGVNKAWPEYLRDGALASEANPDAGQYVVLADNLMQRGAFSRCQKAPFVPDMLRTPMFPLFVGFFKAAGGMPLVYWALIAVHVACCFAAYALAHIAFGRKSATIACFLMATDSMVAFYNLQVMSESLFTLLFTTAVAAILLSLSSTGSPRRSNSLAIASGLLLGLATLTRPTSLYYPAVLAVAWLCNGFIRHKWRQTMKPLLIASCCSLVIPLPWVIRNYAVFSLPKLTTVDTTNFVYFVGAGGYQVHYGIGLDEAQHKISDEFGLPLYTNVQNHWKTRQTPAEMEHQLRRAVLPVLTKYPRELAWSLVRAVFKASISHDVGWLGKVLRREWRPPGFRGLATLDGEAYQVLLSNHPICAGAFVWQMLHSFGSLSLCVCGIYLAVSHSDWRAPGVLLLLTLLFGYATVAMFGFEAYYRCRIPVLPFVYAFAGLAVQQVFRITRVQVVKA